VSGRATASPTSIDAPPMALAAHLPSSAAMRFVTSTSRSGSCVKGMLGSTLPLLRKREFLLAITLAAEIHAVSWVAWPALALPAAPQNALVPGGRAVRFFRLRGGADDPATPPSLERGPQAASEGQGVGVTGADAIGCGGAASPMRELQERMRMGATSNASTSASGFKAKEYTFIPGFDGP